jgi:hypothetical protein
VDTAACGGLRSAPDCRTSKDLPSSLVQLRSAVWTGDTRDTRPKADITSGSRANCGAIYFASGHTKTLKYLGSLRSLSLNSNFGRF